MSKEYLEALESSVVLKFVVDLLKRYEGKTDYNIYITKDWLLEIKQALQRLESIDNAKPSEITLRELVSKHILNPNSVVDVFEQDKNEPHYSNRIFMGMAWEMEKHEIGNRKLKYIFSAVAETISESDRVCIEVK